MATGSPEDIAGPESEFGGSAARPGDGHLDRDTAQFDVQVSTPRLRCDGRPRRWSHRQRQRDELACLRGRLGITASGQLAPAMNDVGIDTVCHGDLGDRRAELGAVRHYLRLRHRAVPPRVRLLSCHRVHLKLDAHDPYRRAARNQDDWAGRIRRTAALSELTRRGSRPNDHRGLHRGKDRTTGDLPWAWLANGSELWWCCR